MMKMRRFWVGFVTVLAVSGVGCSGGIGIGGVSGSADNVQGAGAPSGNTEVVVDPGPTDDDVDNGDVPSDDKDVAQDQPPKGDDKDDPKGDDKDDDKDVVYEDDPKDEDETPAPGKCILAAAGKDALCVKVTEVSIGAGNSCQQNGARKGFSQKVTTEINLLDEKALGTVLGGLIGVPSGLKISQVVLVVDRQATLYRAGVLSREIKVPSGKVMGLAKGNYSQIAALKDLAFSVSDVEKSIKNNFATSNFELHILNQ